MSILELWWRRREVWLARPLQPTASRWSHSIRSWHPWTSKVPHTEKGLLISQESSRLWTLTLCTSIWVPQGRVKRLPLSRSCRKRRRKTSSCLSWRNRYTSRNRKQKLIRRSQKFLVVHTKKTMILHHWRHPSLFMSTLASTCRIHWYPAETVSVLTMPRIFRCPSQRRRRWPNRPTITMTRWWSFPTPTYRSLTTGYGVSTNSETTSFTSEASCLQNTLRPCPRVSPHQRISTEMHTLSCKKFPKKVYRSTITKLTKIHLKRKKALIKPIPRTIASLLGSMGLLRRRELKVAH